MNNEEVVSILQKERRDSAAATVAGLFAALPIILLYLVVLGIPLCLLGGCMVLVMVSGGG